MTTSPDTPRFPELTQAEMTDEQKDLIRNYAASGRLSPSAAASFRIKGGLNVMLRSPELAARLSRVMEYFRRGTALPPRLNEFAILIVAREWTAQYQWQSHYPLAIKAGISESTLADLAQSRRPSHMQPDEAIVYDFLRELHHTRGISDATFRKTREALGERQLVDLVGVCGYYTLGAQMHRTADVKALDSSKPMLPVLQNEDRAGHRA